MCKPLLGNQTYEELLKELEGNEAKSVAPRDVVVPTSDGATPVVEEGPKKPLAKREDLPEFLKFLLSQKYIDDELAKFYGDDGYNMRLSVYDDEDDDKTRCEKLRRALNFVLELVLENKLLLFKFHQDMTKLKANISFTHVSDNSLSTLGD